MIRPSPLAPGLPTIAATVPGYESLAFYGLFVPVNTPAAIITRLNAESRKYLDLAETKERFFSSGVEAVSSTPQEFASFLQNETTVWAKVIRSSGLKPE